MASGKGKAPPSQKVAVYEKATGQRFERWPVDAKEMVATGEFTFDPQATDAPPPEEGEKQASHITQDGDGRLYSDEGDKFVGEVDETSPPILTPESTEHPSGGPLKVTKSEDAGPAKKVEIPSGSKAAEGKKK